MALRTIRFRARLIRALTLLCVLPSGAAAQEQLAVSLSDAIEIARENNPGYLATRNDVDVRDWEVKAAYGSLYTPTVSASSGVSWRGSGDVQLGTLTSDQLGFADQPSFLFSNYSLDIGYSLDGRTLLAPGQARANRDATRAQIRTAEWDLGFNVTLAYLEILRQEDALRLARQELERAGFNLRLAQGQREVGSASALDERQAEVAVGRAEVSVLQTETAVRIARLRLLQQMGLDLDRELILTSDFAVVEPDWNAQDLYRRALDEQPGLVALRAQEEAASYGVKIARSAYFPTLRLGANFTGFTREATSTDLTVARARAGAENQIQSCQALNEIFRRLADPLPTSDCDQFALGESDIRRIREENDVFPFDFSREPPQLGLTVSLPIFQGLTRQREVEAAQVREDDAQLQLREQELALRVSIAAELANVRTAYQTAVLEARNQEVADEQLRLARERYQLGSSSFLELVEAETVKAQADREQVGAIFSYHEALARLEAVVGAQLRPSDLTP